MILSETRSILKGLGKGGLPPLPPPGSNAATPTVPPSRSPGLSSTMGDKSTDKLFDKALDKASTVAVWSHRCKIFGLRCKCGTADLLPIPLLKRKSAKSA